MRTTTAIGRQPPTTTKCPVCAAWVNWGREMKETLGPYCSYKCLTESEKFRVRKVVRREAVR